MYSEKRKDSFKEYAKNIDVVLKKLQNILKYILKQ